MNRITSLTLAALLLAPLAALHAAVYAVGSATYRFDSSLADTVNCTNE